MRQALFLIHGLSFCTPYVAPNNITLNFIVQMPPKAQLTPEERRRRNALYCRAWRARRILMDPDFLRAEVRRTRKYRKRVADMTPAELRHYREIRHAAYLRQKQRLAGNNQKNILLVWTHGQKHFTPNRYHYTIEQVVLFILPVFCYPISFLVPHCERLYVDYVVNM